METRPSSWNGFDVTLSARPRNGLLVQGGGRAGKSKREQL